MTDTTQSDSSTTTETALPGWYPDPMAAGHERWWSGLGWTEYQQPVAAPTVLDTPPAAHEAIAPVDDTHALSRAAGFGYAPAQYPYSAEIAAPPPENTFARKGFLYAILAIVVNLAMIPSIGAIVYGAKGVRRARDIERLGYTHLAMLGRSRFILVTGIVMTCATLIAVGSAVYRATPHYDRVAVQNAIHGDVLTQGEATSTVACPASASFSTGSKFDCSVTLADASTLWAIVTVVDAQGSYTWTYQGEPGSASS